MSSLSFFPLIPAVTTASAAPVYHGGMIPWQVPAAWARAYSWRMWWLP